MPVRITQQRQTPEGSGCLKLGLPSASSVTMDSLPDELLVLIFERHGFDTAADVRISHVCHRWRNILLGMSQFWADACTEIGAHHRDQFRMQATLERLQTFLPRSKFRPLKLTMSAFDATVWRVLSGHSNRISALSISLKGSAHIQELHALVGTTMPNLQELTVEECLLFQLPKAELTPWQTTNLPRLCKLNVPASYFTRATALPSLTAIDLEGFMASSDAFIQALRKCPNLVRIDLGYCIADGGGNGGSTNPSDPKVALPHLRTLNISSDHDTLAILLPPLELPNTALFRVDFIHGDHGALGRLVQRLPAGWQFPGFQPDAAAPAIDHMVVSVEPNRAPSVVLLDSPPGHAAPFVPEVHVLGFSGEHAGPAPRFHAAMPAPHDADADADSDPRAFGQLVAFFDGLPDTVSTLIVNVPPLHRARALTGRGNPWERLVDAFAPALRVLSVTPRTARGVKRRVTARFLRMAAEAAAAAAEEDDGEWVRVRALPTFTVVWALDTFDEKPQRSSAVRADLDALVDVLEHAPGRRANKWHLLVRLVATRRTRYLSEGVEMFLRDRYSAWKDALLRSPHLRRLAELADELAIRIDEEVGCIADVPLRTGGTSGL